MDTVNIEVDRYFDLYTYIKGLVPKENACLRGRLKKINPECI